MRRGSARHAAIARATEVADRFEPAEDLFDPLARTLADRVTGASPIQTQGDFSTPLYLSDPVESKDMARQTDAPLGPRPRLAAKVAAPSRRSSPNGCKGRKSRIARLGKQRDEVG